MSITSPASDQILPTLDGEMPTAFAIRLRGQCVGSERAFLHRLRDHLQARLPRQRWETRRPGLVALQAAHVLTKKERSYQRHTVGFDVSAPHDLDRAMAIRRGQHNPRLPEALARDIAVGNQGLEFGSITGGS